jgi:hypothetical protein
MPTKASRLERQRQKIRELVDVDPTRSSTSIARELRCGVNTVIRTRERYVPPSAANGTANGKATAHPGMANLSPPPLGNDRAVQHGAYSAARRAPLEAQHRDRLRAEFPQAPDDLINAAARRCAMLDLFSAWVADNGPVRGRGDVAPAARETRLLLLDHERAFTALGELDRAGRGAGHQTLADIEAELGEDDPDDVDESEGS